MRVSARVRDGRDVRWGGAGRFFSHRRPRTAPLGAVWGRGEWDLGERSACGWCYLGDFPSGMDGVGWWLVPWLYTTRLRDV